MYPLVVFTALVGRYGFLLAIVTSRDETTFTDKFVANETAQMNYTRTNISLESCFIFPEIHDGNALQPTLDLLLSQKRYREKMNKIYHRMVEKNEKAPYLEHLDAMICNTRPVINFYIESVQEYLTNGAPNDEVKRQPWCGAASDNLLHCWRKMKEWCEKMKDGERLDAEIDAMITVVESAILEMEVYEKYSDMIYDETLKATEKVADIDPFLLEG